MSATTHYENANFLRELAESLHNIFPDEKHDKTELLQRLANAELAQAEYDEWVRIKVATARTDTRPGMSTDQLRHIFKSRSQELRDAL